MVSFRSHCDRLLRRLDCLPCQWNISRKRIEAGLKEIRYGTEPENLAKVRRRGTGRRKIEAKHDKLVDELNELVDPATRGDPESALRRISRSTRNLAHGRV